VRRRLGSGGFATVWLAHDEQLDAEVAIKVLADNWAHDDSVRRRFLEEGRFLRRVESEHVVQVHDVGELEDGRPFLVLTYADRGTLADRLKREPLPLEPAIGVIVQVGRGLQALHRRGLLHRDVKPANVLFRSTDEGERAVLSDLGLGKSLDEVSRITMPGGTPSYVAPEQAMGERLDQRADQYSLGAVAYAALTGRSPHQVDGLGAAGRVEAPAPPSSLGFDIPDKVDAAIVRALDPDREKRWPDVESFARELVGALDETTHSFLPAGATIAASFATAETEIGEKTALSDSNAPTVIKLTQTTDSPTAPAPGPTSPAASTPAAGGSTAPDAAAGTASGGAAASAGATASAPTTAEGGVSSARPRRRGRWVVAAVLALVLGGGAGFGVERYLAPGQLVAVSKANFSLQIPREWAGVVAQSKWRPPGGTAEWPALRVSKDESWSTPGAETPGLFVGLMSRDGDPRKKFPDPKQYGCKTTNDITETPSGDGTVLDQFSFNCDGASTLLQRVVDTGTGDSMFVQVKVPSADQAKAVDVADSVQYS
jgi:hypothetical protein